MSDELKALKAARRERDDWKEAARIINLEVEVLGTRLQQAEAELAKVTEERDTYRCSLHEEQEGLDASIALNDNLRRELATLRHQMRAAHNDLLDALEHMYVVAHKSACESCQNAAALLRRYGRRE